MRELGVSQSSIKEARRNGFPASWFDVLDRMGAEKKVPVPRELFNWREPSKADAAQGGAAA